MTVLGNNGSASQEAELLSKPGTFAGDRFPNHSAQAVTCTNCGVEHGGDYCPACGQAVHLHQTLSAIGHDLMHGVLHLDGKLWETLPLLMFRPGELTRRYIAGERVKFVSPMSMFLFTVFAMFAVFQIVGISAPTDITAEASLPEQMKQDKDNIQRRINEIESRLAAAAKAGKSTTAEIAALDEAKSRLRAYDGARTIVLSEELGASVTFKKVGIYLIDYAVDKWEKNPGLMIYKLQSNAYKFSWIIIPLLIPFFSLLFLTDKRFGAYKHAVFITYSLSFVSLIFIVCSAISAIENIGVSAFALLGVLAPLHLYVQLRQAYNLSHASTLWRFVAIIAAVQVVMLAFLILLALIGAF